MFTCARRTIDAVIRASRSVKYRYTVAREIFAALATSAMVVFVMPNRSKHDSAAFRIAIVTSVDASGSVFEVIGEQYRYTSQ